MSRKRHKKRKKSGKVKPGTEQFFESDENFAFIAGYTSGGAPYGLTHEEWNEIQPETENEGQEKNNSDLPF